MGNSGDSGICGGGGSGSGGGGGGDRANAFNPQSRAYNPTSANAGSSMASRSQASMDSRYNAFNPQSRGYNPTSSKK